MLVELQEHARIVVVIDERAAVELVEQRLIAIAVRDPGIAAVLRGVEAGMVLASMMSGPSAVMVTSQPMLEILLASGTARRIMSMVSSQNGSCRPGNGTPVTGCV